MRPVTRVPIRQSSCRSDATGRLTRGGFKIVVCLLAALVLLAADLPTVHEHHAPGVYNQDCPLARLAAVAPRTPLPDPIAAPRPLPVCEAPSPTLRVELAPPPVASCAPRGPPAVV